MKKAIKSELKQIDSYFKALTKETKGCFVRTKFATVPAKGNQPCKEMNGKDSDSMPDFLIYTSHRTNPGNVKPLHFPNQDAFAIYACDQGDSPYMVVVLTDGHGTNGHFVSMIACTHLCKYVIEATDRCTKDMSDAEWESMLVAAFDSAEAACGPINTHMSGATCSLLVIKPDFIVQANVGDSLAILASKTNVEVLTNEDKPNKPEEAARIQNCGGKVINLSGSLRVFPVGLAITRAIGDTDGRKYGVICTPHVIKRGINATHVFAVVGSDGVWDEVSPEEVRQACSTNYSQQRHEKLVTIAQEKYLRSAGGYADDATLVYVDLVKFKAAYGGN